MKSSSLHRQQEYEYWLSEIEADYPEGHTIEETRYGCAVYKDGELVDEWDYERYYDNPAMVRY